MRQQPEYPLVTIMMPDPWGDFFSEKLNMLVSGYHFVSWSDVDDPDDISYALVVQPREDDLNAMRNLRGIIVIGAGADHVLCLSNLPDVPLARLPQSDLRQRMTEYILLYSLSIHRRQHVYLEQQKNKQWQMLIPQAVASERIVTILGAGYLGQHAAQALSAAGFQVKTWSREPKTIEGAACYYGDSQMTLALDNTDILVVLLPLTDKTEKIICRETLSDLPRGASIINVGRGGLVDDEALLEALDTGHINEAVLDVFTVEPLPDDHPYWHHPKVRVTPHCASAVMPDSIALILQDTLQKLDRGCDPEFLVNREKGY